MIWPNDADGDVLRRLESQGFVFSEPHWIDFNVDFQKWPPPPEALERIQIAYPVAAIHKEEDEDPKYVLVQFFQRLDYQFVVRVQADLSNIVRPFGGVCDSWGVLS